MVTFKMCINLRNNSKNLAQFKKNSCIFAPVNRMLNNGCLAD